jgi:geranyl-CoA carboxylase beta subunit
VLRIVTEDKHLKAMGIEPIRKCSTCLSKSLRMKLDSQSTALYGTASLWDDGMIDPRDTRRVIAMVLDVCQEAERRPLNSNTYGVARL